MNILLLRVLEERARRERRKLYLLMAAWTVVASIFVGGTLWYWAPVIATIAENLNNG